MDQRSLELLAEIARIWNRVEGRAKEAESFRGEAIIASINEMRYAGRRIVDAILLAAAGSSANGDDASFIEHLAVAKNYLINADHDLTDSIVFMAHIRIKKTEEAYGRSVIEANCPRFAEMYPAIRAAQDVVKGSREDRVRRSEDYRKLADTYVPLIMDLYNEICACDALKIDLEERLSLLERNIELVTWVAVVGSVASLVGTGIAIVTLF